MTKTILQKYIANTGTHSRRQAEELIRAGRVSVNGEQAELGQRVDDNDTVLVDGRALSSAKEAIYIKFNKPAGYTCTSRQFAKEKNIYSLLPKEFANLQVVGRLDKDSRGLVLLTNDGELTYKLTHPRYGHEKEYLVSIKNLELKIKNPARGAAGGYSIERIVADFKRGVDISASGDSDGPSAGSGLGSVLSPEIARAKELSYLGEGVFRIVLAEGKKRQIRRMFRAIGLHVSDLLRVRVGDAVLGSLPEGAFEQITKSGKSPSLSALDLAKKYHKGHKEKDKIKN